MLSVTITANSAAKSRRMANDSSDIDFFAQPSHSPARFISTGR
jgi:hypothetical protein